MAMEGGKISKMNSAEGTKGSKITDILNKLPVDVINRVLSHFSERELMDLMFMSREFRSMFSQPYFHYLYTNFAMQSQDRQFAISYVQ